MVTYVNLRQSKFGVNYYSIDSFKVLRLFNMLKEKIFKVKLLFKDE